MLGIHLLLPAILVLLTLMISYRFPLLAHFIAPVQLFANIAYFIHVELNFFQPGIYSLEFEPTVFGLVCISYLNCVYMLQTHWSVHAPIRVLAFFGCSIFPIFLYGSSVRSLMRIILTFTLVVFGEPTSYLNQKERVELFIRKIYNEYQGQQTRATLQLLKESVIICTKSENCEVKFCNFNFRNLINSN